MAELEQEFETNLSLGLFDGFTPEELASERPSKYQAACALVEDDWREYITEWPRAKYPATRDGELDPRYVRTAADRLLKAVKALQAA